MKGSETMSTSMTKGNPLKLMLQFALPLLIGNLLQQTYNIIDAAIVGQILGAKALEQAAVYSFWFWDSVWDAVPDSVYRLPSTLGQTRWIR